MIRTTAIIALGALASVALADEAVATRPAPNPGGGNAGVAIEVDPGTGAPIARRPPLPRDLTQPEVDRLLRVLPRMMRRQHQQCVRQHQPDRRVRVRTIVRAVPGNPLRVRIIPRPANPGLQQCLQRWTERMLRSRLRNRTPRNAFTTAHQFELQAEPVVDVPPQPNQNPVVVRQAVERALAGQRSIFRRCFAGPNVAGVATLRIQVLPDGTLQLLGASVPPGTGTAPLNCLGQLVATTPTGLTGNVPTQTVEWTIQLMEPMPGTEPVVR